MKNSMCGDTPTKKRTLMSSIEELNLKVELMSQLLIKSDSLVEKFERTPRNKLESDTETNEIARCELSIINQLYDIADKLEMFGNSLGDNLDRIINVIE